MTMRDRRVTWDQLGNTLADNGARPADLDRFEAFASRRRFLGQSTGYASVLALGGLGAGLDAVMQGLFGRGLIPVAWAQEAESASQIAGKPGMTVHSTRPVTGEFLPHLLDDDITPTERHFVRNNAEVPERAEKQDFQDWKLTIDGEVHRTLELTIEDLKAMPAVTMPLLIECGGSGRGLFDPPVRGNQWGRGAIACSEWTGVRLRDVLERAGLKDSAKYTGHYGGDIYSLAKPFSRGVPIDKALEEHTLVAYRMNGKNLSALNGFPARIVVPGWLGSCSQKWLTRISIRDRVHDAQKMNGYAYRVPKNPVRPGTRPPKSEMEIATAWIIKSMITRPAADSQVRVGTKIPVAGHAWAGERKVEKVLVSTDYGVGWKKALLKPAPNKYAWNRWETQVSLPNQGYYEIWARAFDDDGSAQPFRQPWNPKGYLGNVIHRLPVLVQA